MNKFAFLQEEREIRRKKALEEHRRMSRLFRENRFEFERQRREAIKSLIESAPNPELRKRLWEMQARWDQRMQSAGSSHNRLILAEAFFWDFVVNQWLPTLTQCANTLRRSDSVTQ